MSYYVKLEPLDSQLIEEFEYDEDTQELRIKFKKYYVDQMVYTEVPLNYFMAFSEATSFGRFYLQMIKPNFSLKKQNMADKVIKIKIDVTKINKDWLYQGEKGVYLNFTALYNEDQDSYGNNGMAVQDVPTEIYKKDKTVKGVILGNLKEFEKSKADGENTPGKESGKIGVKDDIADDLPF